MNRISIMTTTNPAATYGYWVANHVRVSAAASSARLSPMFETGSGDPLTAARSAVFPE